MMARRMAIRACLELLRPVEPVDTAMHEGELLNHGWGEREWVEIRLPHEPMTRRQRGPFPSVSSLATSSGSAPPPELPIAMTGRDGRVAASGHRRAGQWWK
jgi:hypothetical protein